MAPGTWVELLLDFEAATGQDVQGFDGPRRGGSAAGFKTRNDLTLRQKADALKRHVRELEAAMGVSMLPGRELNRASSLRDHGIQRHQDVLNKIHENSDILANLRKVPAMVQPYYS